MVHIVRDIRHESQRDRRARGAAAVDHVSSCADGEHSPRSWAGELASAS